MSARRILVVDDEPGIRQALGQLLEYEGYEVKTATGGAEGITIYDSFRPQLVFLDVKMAGLDGLEVLKRLRSGDAAERDAMRERMEAAVMQQLDPEAAPWLSAIVAGMDARVPEPPIPGGRLVR